ncbi:MAG: hypothetical protein Q8Q59_10870, partial [Luteolibacter sp.]|nr:hypothetical protein [Luteolibacter sp.]
MVERGLLPWPDEREDGVAQKREVLGSFGFAPHSSVFAPQGGVFLPVVFVFHRPMTTGDFRKPRMARFSL